MRDLVFCLMGPTASGKTAMAMELVQQFPFEIISVDSAMIYKGMDIGTAKPSAQELIRAPHHLIDCAEVTDPYSVAQFVSDATRLCQELFKKNKIPLLVGGTMMYFRALQQGLSCLPEADGSIRQEIEARARREGWPVLHEELSRIDAQSALKINAHDAQRIQRALEVYYVSGQTLSQLHVTQKKLLPYQWVNLALTFSDRAVLHERIALRLKSMWAQGLIDEVKYLQQKYILDLSHPAMRCVGYRQVMAYLQGELAYNLLHDKTLAATRQLAKRQLTWLRSWNDVAFYDVLDAQSTPHLLEFIKKMLDNRRS